MPAFAIISPAEDPRLSRAVIAKFPRHYKMGSGQYVVNDVGPTAQTVAMKLGPDGEAGKFVVFSVAGYWGFHDKALWEWLTLNSN